MELNKVLKRKTEGLLALIYSEIDWRKNKVNSPWDVFNHRVRAASRKRTIGEFVSKLCNYFGIQSLPLTANKIINALSNHQNEVLNYIYSEHIPITLKAIEMGKKIKENRKKASKGKNN